MDVLTSAILIGLDTREQTLTRVAKQTKSTEILEKIQCNPSNKICADCAAADPVWGVINLGVMVCINCSGTLYSTKNVSVFMCVCSHKPSHRALIPQHSVVDEHKHFHHGHH